MKRTLAILLALLMALSIASCGAQTAKSSKTPDGYTIYENEAISFAYPEDWTVTDGSTVTITGPNGNNITVVYEDKTDMYENMTTESYKSELVPVYESMGLAIENPTVKQTKHNGMKFTIFTHTMITSTKRVDQTQYITTIGDKTHIVTVTEVVADDALVENVLQTLNKVN